VFLTSSVLPAKHCSARQTKIKSTVLLTVPRWFANLSPNDQWELYRFYRPASDMTDRELIAHRRAVKAADSSLPQRAGWAYARLSRGQQTRVAAETANGRVIYVRSVVRPEPDLKMLAKVYMQTFTAMPDRSPERA
jgi:hypothetical protein